MFSGIVEACVPVRAIERRGTGARLLLPLPEPGWEAAPGDSVAVSGCCLTVVGEPADGCLAFDLSAETLARTSLGALAAGSPVNLERSVRPVDRLGGHLVSGHVDGLGTIVAVDDPGDGGRTFTFELDEGLERWMIEKGSVTLDGISLTVCEPVGRRFSVAVIPVTLEVTTLGSATVGQRVNVEGDAIGKWVAHLLGERALRTR